MTQEKKLTTIEACLVDPVIDVVEARLRDPNNSVRRTDAYALIGVVRELERRIDVLETFVEQIHAGRLGLADIHDGAARLLGCSEEKR